MIFNNRPFSRIWLAGVLSLAGTQVSRIALILYLFRERGTVIDLAIFVTLDQLPGIFMASLAGSLIDRGNKRRIMIAADLFRAASMLAILANPTLPAIYIMVAVNSMAAACFHPAATSSIAVVVNPAQLTQANAWQQGAQNVVFVIGPPVGAYLLVKVGLNATLIIDIVSYLVSAALLWGTVIPELQQRERNVPGLTLGSSVFGGWSYLARHRLERHLATILFFATICPGLWTPLAPFFIRDFLNGSDQLLGWQIGAFGLGAAAGAAIAPMCVNRIGKGRSVTIAMVGEAAIMIIYSIVPRPEMSLLVILVWGIIGSHIVIPYYTILQSCVAENHLGRTLSVLKQLEACGITLAMIVAVALIGSVGSHVVLLAGGAVYLIAALGLAFTATGQLLNATV